LHQIVLFRKNIGKCNSLVGSTSVTIYNHYVDGDRSEEVMNHLLTVGGTTSIYGTWQDKQDRKAKEALDLAKAQVAKAIVDNMPNPNWDNGGGSDPKWNKNFSIWQRILWGGVSGTIAYGQVKGIFNEYEPIPSEEKDPSPSAPAPILPITPTPIPAPAPITPSPITPVVPPSPTPLPNDWFPLPLPKELK